MYHYQQKTVQRARLMAARQAMTALEKQAAEAAICARLTDWFRVHPVASLGVYYPIQREPDLSLAYNAFSAQGIRLALPVVCAQSLCLDFLSWQPGEQLCKDAWGTWIPKKGLSLKPQALLIPCLGFNAARARLGYGGGFYDRSLATQRPRPLTIGIAYTGALTDFTAEAHDLILDLMMTG